MTTTSSTMLRVKTFRTVQEFTCAPRVRRVSRGIAIPVITHRINSADSKGALFFSSPKERRATYLKELWGIAKKAGDMVGQGPPRHEMAYFKGLATSARGFGEFRRVLHTGLYSQLVVMEVPVGGEIGDDVCSVDKVLIFTAGKGLATVAGKNQDIEAGDVVIVPAGTQHQVVTQGDQPLELISIFSPAEHSTTTVHKNKEQGDREEAQGIDEAPGWSRRCKVENEAAGLVNGCGNYHQR